MQYPLPYAFARSHQLLLEDQDGALTLWLHALESEADYSAVGEVMRKYGVQPPMPKASPVPPPSSARSRPMWTCRA